MSNICVVHLVRAENGLSPFADFLRSYREHPAGIAHELLLLCKGFGAASPQLPADYGALLADVPHRTLFVPDEGFDIGPYFVAARELEYRRFCFLNSFSRVLDAGWLAKLAAHAEDEGVGVVSATGSYESYYTNLARELRPALYLRRAAYSIRHAGRPESVSDYMSKRSELAAAREMFDPFPNQHVRTNAFVIAREVMLDLKVGAIRNKMDAAIFESGKAGLTRQLSAKGLRALVVGRDGVAYAGDEWRESYTFRSGEQRNLLVADNRTRQYEEADPPTRKFLEEFAWGV